MQVVDNRGCGGAFNLNAVNSIQRVSVLTVSGLHIHWSAINALIFVLEEIYHTARPDERDKIGQRDQSAQCLGWRRSSSRCATLAVSFKNIAPVVFCYLGLQQLKRTSYSAGGDFNYSKAFSRGTLIFSRRPRIAIQFKTFNKIQSCRNW